MYKEYRHRREDLCQTRREALYFGTAADIQQSLMESEYLEDVRAYLFELRRNGFVSAFKADNTLYQCTLTATAISAMENLPKDTLLSIADFISKFIP